MILIGLTGGIACGKSTVSSMLEQHHHIQIIDADAIVRQLQAPGAPCTCKIGQRWPECVDPLTGSLRREVLSSIVFNNTKARADLAKIMNFPIFRTIVVRIASYWWKSWWDHSTDSYLVVLDAPTLFESGLFCFLISNSIVVACPESVQIQRLRARNGFSEKEARSRIECQMPLSQKRKLAGYVIDNDTANLESLRKKVDESVVWMRQQGEYKLNIIAGSVLGVSALSIILLYKAVLQCSKYIHRRV